MPNSEVHSLECACRACAPSAPTTKGEALGLFGATALLVAFVLFAVAAGLHIQSYVYWE